MASILLPYDEFVRVRDACSAYCRSVSQPADLESFWRHVALANRLAEGAIRPDGTVSVSLTDETASTLDALRANGEGMVA